MAALGESPSPALRPPAGSLLRGDSFDETTSSGRAAAADNGNGSLESEIMASPTVTREGNHTVNHFMVCGNLFEVDAKYAPIKPIGKGAYGVVCSARNAESDETLAIKKISNAFDNVIDAKRTLREIKLLRHLQHENIIAIKDIMMPPASAAFNDVYIVYELMDTDLHQIIRSNQPLSDDHCQYFVYQLLRGLKYIHSANVLHRDLKPSNLLLNANCDLKICDFGLARTGSEKEYMTEYVVTRWYRAPELLLSCTEYTAAIDMWSVGCIFAELLGRKPLFPGRDYVNQLNLITKLLGSPSEEDLSFINSERARRYIRTLPTCLPVPLSDIFPGANAMALDLIAAMLVFDPSKRLTVEEALQHPYLASLHDVNDEPAAAAPFEFDFENSELTEDAVRALVCAEVLLYHPERAAELNARMRGAPAAGGDGGG